jgi:hypothetical protein
MAGPGAAKSSKEKHPNQAAGRSAERSSQPLPAGPQANILAWQDAAGNEAVSRSLQSAAATQAHVVSGVSPNVRDALQVPGQPLDTATRNLMESRFGHDFGKVRLHTDARAASLARSLQARAFALGNDVVFGHGQYAPQTFAGKSLLAHELAHVVQQQASGQQVVARQPVGHYETQYVSYPRTDVEKLVGVSYWEQRVARAYRITYIDPVTARFKADAEERDAVLSVLWQVRPKGKLTTETSRTVSIPVRGGARTSKPLLYKFTFKPKQKGQKHSEVWVTFVAEGSKTAVTAAPTPPAGYTPSSLRGSAEDFPGGIDKYWKGHPKEHQQLYHWIEKVAPSKFDQIVTTKATTKRGRRTVTHTSSFQVAGTKDSSGKVTRLNIKYLGSTAPKQEQPPADYKDKDAVDLELEKAHPTKKDRVGKIRGLKKVPAGERLSVKYAIWGYFNSGTRNAEVDAIVPIAHKTARVYYTLRFRRKAGRSKLVNVDVERIGEEGKTSAKVAPKRLDVARVEGYASNTKDPATFRAWLKKRYPGVSATGATVPDLRKSVNAKMQRQAGSAGWFKDNYDIHILDPMAGDSRLRTVHKFAPPQLQDIKAFTSDELKLLEFTLQTMSELLLALLKATRMVRQKVSFERRGRTGPFRENRHRSGRALKDGMQKTIIIFDDAFAGDASLFIGGKRGVRPISTMTYAHEAGHLVGFSAGIERAFNRFVKKKRIKPVTRYAKGKPTKEFFPEAFALYQMDPEWMKTNQPDLFKWFETLSQTGKAPRP